MRLKKFKIIGTFVIFAFCFLAHFLYNWLSFDIVGWFFPVNESIWEHMKLLFTPFIIYTLIEWLFIRNKIKINNLSLQLFLIPLISIIVYLAIYLPIYSFIGENMAVSIGLLFIVIALEQVLSYFLAKSKVIDYQRVIGSLGLFIVWLGFIYLTYLPPKTALFHDTSENIYGIEK